MQLHICDIENPLDYGESTVWGRIYIQINDICFPNNKWHDAVSSILDMWTAEITEYIYEKKEECYLYFMDGPFLISLSKLTDTGYVLVSCKNRETAEVFDTTIRFLEFVEEVLTVTHKFLEMCIKRSPSFINTKTFSRTITSCNVLEDFLTGTGSTGDGLRRGQGDGSVVPSGTEE